MRGRGLVPPADLIQDGRIHRCDADEARGKQDGAYSLFSDESGGGWFQNWKDGLGVTTWFPDTGRQPTSQELESRRIFSERARREGEAEEQTRKKEARDKAKFIWVTATPCKYHPYLEKKGVQPHGTKVATGSEYEGCLVLSLRDTQGLLHSLQFISNDGTSKKRFLSGGKKKGCFFMIGCPGSTICIAEGFATGASIHEATGLPVAVAFDAGNLLPVAEALREKNPEADLVICADDDYAKNTNTGLEAGRNAASAVNGRIAVPNFGEHRPDGATDFNDLHQFLGPEAVKASLMESMSPNQDAPLVAASAGTRGRRRSEPEAGESPGLCPLPEPWHEPVNPALLLAEIRSTIKAFIVCEEEVAVAATLWVAFTWFIDVVQVAPLALITAPEPQCGKTQLLYLLGRLVRKPMLASNISPAAVYRIIESEHPTLMIDEADSFMKGNEDMRNVINSGHTRQTAQVIRVVGEDYTPKAFSTWGAKALSGIGHLAPTIMDRSIVLELRRKKKDEKVMRLRHAATALFSTLASKLRRFAQDASESIRQARPELPDELGDRSQDNWEPLLAIADYAGGEWPTTSREAALKLASTEQGPKSRASQLLADVRDAFGDKDKISTRDLIGALCSDELKPWQTFNKGYAIDASQVAKMLREYKIHPKDIKLPGGSVRKGYARKDLEDAWTRYLDEAGEVAENEPLPATNESWCGSTGSPRDDGRATIRYQMPSAMFDVAPATRYLGATPKPAPSLSSSGVAHTEGEGRNSVPGNIQPLIRLAMASNVNPEQQAILLADASGSDWDSSVPLEV